MGCIWDAEKSWAVHGKEVVVPTSHKLAIFIVVLSFFYKMDYIYEIYLAKVVYYTLSIVIGGYLLFSRSSNSRYQRSDFVTLLVFCICGWQLLSIIYADKLGKILGASSIINILTWYIVMAYFYAENESFRQMVGKILFYLLWFSAAILILNYGMAFAGNGRMKGVFVDVAPFTNYLIIYSVFGWQILFRKYGCISYVLALIFQFLTFTRSSLASSFMGSVMVITRHMRLIGRGIDKTVLVVLVVCMAVPIAILSKDDVGTLEEIYEKNREGAVAEKVQTDNEVFNYVSDKIDNWFDGALNDRMLHWSLGLEEIGKVGVFGRGLGGYFRSDEPGKYGVGTGYNHTLQAHNLFLDAALAYGVVFALLMTILYVYSLYTAVLEVFFGVDQVRYISAVYIIACSPLAFTGLELITSSHLLNKFWWLSLGVLALRSRNS